MTKNNLQKKFNIKSIFILTIICILCFSFSFLFACNSTTSSTESSFSKNEVDEAVVKNGSFEFGSIDKKLTDYPIINPTGWSRTIDNSSINSKVNSGIIKTSDEGWMELLRKMYSNSYFLDYAKSKYGFDEEYITGIKNEIKDANPSYTQTELNNATRDKVIEEKIIPNFANPKTHNPEVPGDKVFMINNYLTKEELGKGAAQKVVSTTTINLKKNSYGKVTVWLKTSNVTLDNSSNTKDGANIRLISTIRTKTQPDYAIYGIACDEWTQYTIYVKSDANYDTTLQVAIGLGFGNGSNDVVRDYTEGTLFIDDVVYEEIEKDAFDSETTSISNNNKTVFEFASEKAVFKNVIDENKVEHKAFLYNLSIEDSIEKYSNSYTALQLNEYNAVYTINKSNKSPSEDANGNISSETILGSESNKGDYTISGNSLFIENIKNYSGIITISSPDFMVGTEEYLYLTFVVKNGLNKLRNSDINIFVENGKTLTSALSTTTVGEDVYCGILLKNNFPKFEANNEDKYSNNPEEFTLKIYIGPKSVADLSLASHFASGKVSFENFVFTTGKTYQYEKDKLGLIFPLEKTENYDFYSFYSEVATSTVVLNSSNVEYTNTSETYNIYNEGSYAGKIKTEPTVAQGFIGIVPDHIYIKDSNQFEINERIGLGNNEGVAGLINTKYLKDYATYNPTLSNLAEELNYFGEKPIQPLMIYNKVASAYGFIGNKITIAQNTQARISVKVRVVGDATANIYLVDVSKTTKIVETLKFTPNTNGFNQITDGSEVTKNLSFENITSDMMDENGWLTVTFYISNGINARDLRLELWNGARDADVNPQGNSQGYVFFSLDKFSEADSFNPQTLSGAFTETEKWEDTFTTSSSVLFGKFDATKDEALMHQRQLSKVEKDFNAKQTDSSKLVSYSPKYVWVKTDNIIYAAYNTIEPIPVDPNSTENDTEEETQSCITTTSPETFWLSFSSILLAVVLLAAIVMLFIKNVRLSKKRNRNDAKSHYKVTSRIKTSKAEKKVKKDVVEKEKEEVIEEQPEVETTTDEPEEKQTEISIDSVQNTAEENEEYVYTEVQNFGDDNEEK
ncbi:MAG: hypothetical protein IKW33_04410 [Clostridia bacterium]|nr:hypothetical protein [Clostridia bacterium]